MPDGFSDTQKTELSEMIAAAVGSAKPPGDDPPKPPVSDDEWSAWSDRKREGYVTSLVQHALEGITRNKKVDELEATVDELKKPKATEPEQKPTLMTALQRMIWGDPQ